MVVVKTLSQLIKDQNKGLTAKFTYDDLMKKRKEDNDKFVKSIQGEQKKQSMNNSIGRSGIQPLHQRCTINNYETNTEEQNFAKAFAFNYIMNFESNSGCGFIFSGESGTGKNHLSAAICNKLIADGKQCLIITVNELIMKLRKCYGSDAECGEDKFIENLVSLDLLVLDEIGLQRENVNEKLVLNQIVDQRISRFKPTGMLTNQNAEEINKTLGIRIMDRMRMNGGQWIPFEWESFRK